MKFTAIIAAAPLLAIPVALAPLANADTATSWGVDNEQRICSVFREFPSYSGVVGIALAIHKETGFTPYQAGEAVGAAVGDYCPSMLPTLLNIANSDSGSGSSNL